MPSRVAGPRTATWNDPIGTAWHQDAGIAQLPMAWRSVRAVRVGSTPALGSSVLVLIWFIAKDAEDVDANHPAPLGPPDPRRLEVPSRLAGQPVSTTRSAPA